MIEDEEFRDLFRAEGEEHLQRLDELLLRLERAPQDAALLDETKREAHTLKGAARMLGVEPVERVTHEMEEILDVARHGPLSPGTIEALYATLDALRRLVAEAVTGAPAGVDVERVLARLAEGARGGDAAAAPTPPPAPSAPTAPSAAAHAEPYRIETLRVSPARLDDLLREAGELRVVAGRAERRVAELQDAAALAEEMRRVDAAVPGAMRDAARGGRGAAARLAALHERRRDLSDRLAARLHALSSQTGADAAALASRASGVHETVRGLRLVPLGHVFGQFPRMVRDLAHAEGKDVELVAEGAETTVDKRIAEELKDPLMHLLRNAVDHGVEAPEERERAGKPRAATVRLAARRGGDHVVVEVSDDGRGIDPARVREASLRRGVATAEELEGMDDAQVRELLFRPGFSTSREVTDVSGRGVGLDVVRTAVERLKGALVLESAPGRGTTFRVRLPLTLATARVLLVHEAGRTFALPAESVLALRNVPAAALAEGRGALTIDGTPASVVRLAHALGIPLPAPEPRGGPAPAEASLPCVLVGAAGERFGLVVDELVDEQEVILKPLPALLRRVRNLSGATLLATGEVCPVLDAADLARTLQGGLATTASAAWPGAAAPAASVPAAVAAARRRAVLLVEDSLTTRTHLKRILEAGGYEVATAVDGADALLKLAMGTYDAILSDVDMPNLDGFELTARVRADRRHKDVPVILVTARASAEDRLRGLEAGANAYVAKGAFDHAVLLDILRGLL